MQQIRILSFSMITSLLLMSFKPSPFGLPENGYLTTAVATFSAKVSWAKVVHNFGDIPHGVPVSVEFIFTNTGDEALIIKEVVTSCGCTTSGYTKEPVMPGKSSKVKVSYNAASAGSFSKTITVNSNDEEAAKVLTITGVVK